MSRIEYITAVDLFQVHKLMTPRKCVARILNCPTCIDITSSNTVVDEVRTLIPEIRRTQNLFLLEDTSLDFGIISKSTCLNWIKISVLWSFTLDVRTSKTQSRFLTCCEDDGFIFKRAVVTVSGERISLQKLRLCAGDVPQHSPLFQVILIFLRQLEKQIDRAQWVPKVYLKWTSAYWRKF